MAKQTQRRSGRVLRWSDICQALKITGHMKNFSKGECWRVNKLLKKQIEQGN